MHGPSTARLLNAAHAIFGPPGICKWVGLVTPNVTIQQAMLRIHIIDDTDCYRLLHPRRIHSSSPYDRRRQTARRCTLHSDDHTRIRFPRTIALQASRQQRYSAHRQSDRHAEGGTDRRTSRQTYRQVSRHTDGRWLGNAGNITNMKPARETNQMKICWSYRIW